MSLVDVATQKETYHRLTEENSWEGETWYHYFVDSPGVLQTLVSTLARIDGHDFSDVIETVYLSDEEATVLANIDEGYMSPHWFGELNVEKISNVKTADELYKGKIRDYAEDLFESVTP